MARRNSVGEPALRRNPVSSMLSYFSPGSRRDRRSLTAGAPGEALLYAPLGSDVEAASTRTPLRASLPVNLTHGSTAIGAAQARDRAQTSDGRSAGGV